MNIFEESIFVSAENALFQKLHRKQLACWDDAIKEFPVDRKNMLITRASLLRSILPQAFLFGSQGFTSIATSAHINSRVSTTLKMSNVTPESLIGRTFDIVYASDHSKDTYRFDVETDNKIKWERIAGTDVGKGDTEDYVITQIDAENMLVTWIEADGLGLSNVLNFKAGTCLTHGNNGRSVWKHNGVLSLVEKKTE